LRNDHICEYKERKKPGLRAGYGRELEGRLDRLETLLEEQGRQLAAHLAESCAITSAPAANPAVPRSSGQDITPETQVQGPYESQTVTFGGEQPFQQPIIDPKLRSSLSRHGSLHE